MGRQTQFTFSCYTFLVLALDPQPVFVMPVKTEGGLDSDENSDCIRVFLKMTLTPKYPEEVPLIEILDQDPEDDSRHNTPREGVTLKVTS